MLNVRTSIYHFFLIVFLLSCGKPITEKKQPSGERNALHQGVSEKILFNTPMSLNFLYLPLEGKANKSEVFWSGDSWPLIRGAINYRWNSPGREAFNLKSPARKDIYSIPLHTLESLSPAEKYDLYKGRYDYPLKQEVDRLARTGSKYWEGLCHGWAGASINHPEPDSRLVMNPDGREIPFGSADIKALLSYAYSKILIREEDSLGKRCDEEISLEEDHCDNDLSPLSFHVVITNKIGLYGQAVIADIDRYHEVWNHPIVSFQSVVEEMVSTPSGRRAIIRTKLRYVDVVDKQSWEKHPSVYGHLTTRYELDLDKYGTITGGRWLSSERPDFLWDIKGVHSFEGYLADVFNLIR